MKQRLLRLVTPRRMLGVLALMFAAGAAHAQAWLNTYNYDYIGAWAYSHNLARSVPNLKPCGWATVVGTQTWVNKDEPCPKTHSSAQAQASPNGANDALSTGEAFATIRGLEQLIAHYPAQNQRQVLEAYTRLIYNFDETVPRAYGIPAHNLATAYAAILAGSYAAYTNRPFPENAVKPLFQQAQQAMLNTPQLLRASVEEKAAIYQVWVGTGSFMLGWQNQLAQHPNPEQQAQMRKAGGDALRALGIDPDRVRFTASGMQFP